MPSHIRSSNCEIFRCSRCKAHTNRKDLEHFISLGNCQGLGNAMPLQSLRIIEENYVSLGATRLTAEGRPPFKRRRIIGKQTWPHGYPSAPQDIVELPRPPMVGRRRLHESHNLEHRRGVIICQSCGFYSVTKPGKLAQPCVPLLKGVISGGRHFLSRWKRDLPPKTDMEWPDPFSELPDGLIWKAC